MKDIDIFGKDKLYHLLVCFFTSIFSPFFTVGLALGKEYGDSKATGNHWCWWDIVADSVGIVCGSVIHYIIFGRLC